MSEDVIADGEVANASLAGMSGDEADARRRQCKAAKYQDKVDKVHARQHELTAKKAAAKE